MTYGAKTGTLTIGLVRKFKVTERVMESGILGVSLKDPIRIEEIRQRTKVVDVALKISKLKWIWTYVAEPMAVETDAFRTESYILVSATLGIPLPGRPMTCDDMRLAMGETYIQWGDTD